MAQVTSGIRRILSLPIAYNFLQAALGAGRLRRRICRDLIRPHNDDVIVDVGCGPAAILELLPPAVRYYGFDLSEDYIRAARERYGDRGNFTCADIAAAPPESVPPCTIALALGMLHHLDDDEARHLMAALSSRVVPGGRLITLDGTFVPGQSAVSRRLVAADRGQNVRTPEAYAALAPRELSVKVHVRHDLLNVPYTHCILDCTKRADNATLLASQAA
ncbi:MAG: class I SAM-dependent methyltransferase [Pseudoxanthomonas sp.]